MLPKMLLLLSLLASLYCPSESLDPFKQLQTYSEQLKVDQLIAKHSHLSQNITFNTTREKYFFIYWPLMETCLQQIGEDFEPLLNSATPTGIGAAGYGIAAGMKIALQVGLWKTGIFGLIKTTTATLFSASVWPIAIGVGTLAYFYNKNEQDKIKAKCSTIIDLFEDIVRQQELQFLYQVKNTVFQELVSLQQDLAAINGRQNSIKKNLNKYQDNLGYLNAKLQMHHEYFTSLKKIMDF